MLARHQAPLLFVLGAQSELVKRMGEELAEEKLRTVFRDGTFATIADAGHMLHHEQPERLAEVMETFFDK